MVERFTSRKLWVVIAVLASATWLVANKHIADGVWSAVVIATVTGYLAANVAQKATAKTPPAA